MGLAGCEGFLQPVMEGNTYQMLYKLSLLFDEKGVDCILFIAHLRMTGIMNTRINHLQRRL